MTREELLSRYAAGDEERALVCWHVLDEIEALFQVAGDAETAE